jgi:hypothetical protein
VQILTPHRISGFLINYFLIVFKTAMESPRFLIGEHHLKRHGPCAGVATFSIQWADHSYTLSFLGSDHDRFRFAKAAITKRKQFAGRGAEEAVVLAVGDGKGSIHVTRKVRRKPLWKVPK